MNLWRRLIIMVLVLLIGGICMADELTLNDDNVTKLKLPEPAKFFIFEGEHFRWTLGKEAFESMTDRELDNFGLAVRILTSGAFFDGEFIESICKRLLPDRFREVK